jgi:hypothetical protein
MTNAMTIRGVVYKRMTTRTYYQNLDKYLNDNDDNDDEEEEEETREKMKSNKSKSSFVVPNKEYEYLRSY